ncbi:acyltransferase family protein [Henriciella aquimarina]|uniref:acyltransferase family protein n=1 Tax=Henriciella aquimarina TaxID=545261 RepID=UPI000A06FF80|nr:acyltransferase family protein [Henriciella aquimarina]
MHHLDALRAMLLLQVVPYHVATLYATQPDWFVKSDDKSLLMTWVSGALGIYSMTGFFMISGWLTIRYLKSRSIDQWMWVRLERLGIPFISCLLLLGPFSILAGTLAADQGVVAAQDIFGGDYLSNLLVVDSRWLGHLWFLPTLLIFSGLIWLAYKARIYDPLLRGLTSAVNAIPGDFACWVFVIAVVCVWRTVAQTLSFVVDEHFGSERPLIGILNFNRLLVHFPAIMLGLMIGYSDTLRRRLMQATWLRTSLVIFFILVFVALSSAESFELKVFEAIIKNGLGVAICTVLIAGLESVFARPQKWVQFISKHSYSVYLFHFATAVLLGVAFRAIHWPPVVEFLVITALTLSFSFCCAVIISRSQTLSFIFNGIPPSQYRKATEKTFRTPSRNQA